MNDQPVPHGVPRAVPGQPARAPGGQALRAQRLVNRVVRGLLRTPLLSRALGRRLVTLYITGRKSGRPYVIPVAYTAQALVRSAAAELAPALQAARDSGIDPELEKQSSIAAARVKVAIQEPALRAASRVFDVGGASAIQASALLDRHWRNLRTLFSHNPTVYKARVLGDIAVNGAELPETSFF